MGRCASRAISAHLAARRAFTCIMCCGHARSSYVGERPTSVMHTTSACNALRLADHTCYDMIGNRLTMGLDVRPKSTFFDLLRGFAEQPKFNSKSAASHDTIPKAHNKCTMS